MPPLRDGIRSRLRCRSRSLDPCYSRKSLAQKSGTAHFQEENLFFLKACEDQVAFTAML